MSGIKLIKEKKDKLFEQEFFPHIDSLYNFAYYLTYDEEDSNDLVQETFLKAYRFADTYREGTNAKAWLFKILKNNFINDYRKKAKQPVRVNLEIPEDIADMENCSTIGTLDVNHEIFQGMLGDEIANALNKLTVDFRTVLLLCDIEDFKYEEIAKILDIPIGTVRSRLFRARNMMKKELKDYADSLGYK